MRATGPRTEAWNILAQTAADVSGLFPENADVAELVGLIEQASALWQRG